MQSLPQPVLSKFCELIKTVREYESDTFSAEESKLTDAEALKITQSLVLRALDSLIELDELDGVIISEELENIRD